MLADIPQIGGIVRSAREGMGLSQSDLAKATTISKQTIVAVENDQRTPSFKVLCQLVHALDIPPDLMIAPYRSVCTLAQERLIREFLACDENEQRIVNEVLQSLLRALRHDISEKQD